VTFGGEVQIPCDFVTAEQFVAPTLHASGDTPMGAAIQRAIDLVTQRKRTYRENASCLSAVDLHDHRRWPHRPVEVGGRAK